MSFERFDEDVRQREKNSYVTLSDSRTFTHKFIFDTYFRSGLKEDFMKEALYRIIMATKFEVKFEDSNASGREIIIDNLLSKSKVNRANSIEVRVEFDSINDNHRDFLEELHSRGTVINLNR